MRYLSVLLFLCAAILPAQQRFDKTMVLDSVTREYIVVRPSGAVPNGGYPVVFMFHGTSGDGEKFYNISGWKEEGEKEKFITVFPSSLEYCVEEDGDRNRTTKWNNGDLVSVACPGQLLKDDVKFTRAMIDSLKSEFRVDASRIYASGFSNGALFTSKLAVEASDVFAALTSAAGQLHILDSAAPKRNIPFMSIVGDMDDRLVEKLPVSRLPLNDSAGFYLRGALHRYASTLGLTDDYTTDSTPITFTFLFRTPKPGVTATQFSYSILKDFGHNYPNGTNFPISAARIFWQFYSRYTLSSARAESSERVRTVATYPNPAHDRVRFEGVGASRVVFRNTLGIEVFEGDANELGVVNLPPLASGLYFAEVRTTSTSNHVVVAKIVIE